MRGQEEPEKHADNRRDQQGRFRKGKSGNPSGRPPKGAALAEILRGVIDTPIGKGKTKAQTIAERLVTLAESGDVAAIRAIFDRIDGKARESVDLSVSQAHEQCPHPGGCRYLISEEEAEAEQKDEDERGITDVYAELMLKRIIKRECRKATEAEVSPEEKVGPVIEHLLVSVLHPRVALAKENLPDGWDFGDFAAALITALQSTIANFGSR